MNAVYAFDFDQWADLARSNVDEFERRRVRVIEQFIDSCPSSRRRRLRGLQFQVDAERRRARTPLQACLRLSSLMWDAALADDGLRGVLAAPTRRPARQTSPPARVIPFRRRD